MIARSFSALFLLATTAGCNATVDSSDTEQSAPTNAVVDELGADDPEVLRSIEHMLSTDSTEAREWATLHQPGWMAGINRIYDTGVKNVVVHEYEEDFIGRVPYALIVDRGTVEWKKVAMAADALLADQKLRDHGWTTTLQYTVVFLY